MGLINAALSSIGSTMKDQWKEYFYCDSMDANTLAVKASKRVSGKNNKGNDNIISDGSVIAVADGQCMIIVEQGKVVDLCAEPGEFIYDMSTEPSIFSGKLGESLKNTFKTMWKRFTFGGETAKDQRVYYFNTKEIIGNKYGTPSPVPFRVVDTRADIDIDISVRCFGEYSYHIVNPVPFYVNVCGNVTGAFTRDKLDSQLKSELLTSLQPAFARISEMGIRYSALPGHTKELADVLREELSAEWGDRGLEIVKVGVSSVKASEEDEKMLKNLQAYHNPGNAAAGLAGATMQAMQDAAKNSGGAAVGFMGMNMAQGATGFNMQNMYAMGAQQQAAAPAPAAPAAAPAKAGWICPQCGHSGNTGKFCAECGTPKPAEQAGWTCTKCGAVNKGKFCAECGSPKPAGVPQYKCDKCGWEPEDPTKPPKFCPECGDPFDTGDII